MGWNEEVEKQFDLGWYVGVWSSDIDESGNRTDDLEYIFHTLNVDMPDNYFGRSLTTSDIVVINGEIWYCDSIGWKFVDFV